jgi:hypothetical protein
MRGGLSQLSTQRIDRSLMSAPQQQSLRNRQPLCVSLGDRIFDRLLRGGLRCGCITELAGE